MTNEKLSALLNTLQIDPSELKKEENFGLKMRIQRVAYLLNYLGDEGFGYSFSTYFRGPYSVDLAKSCSVFTDRPSGSLEREELVKWFFDHELDWLNAAVTIMMLHASYRGREEEEFQAVRHYRERLTEEEYASIMAELRVRGILRD